VWRLELLRDILRRGRTAVDFQAEQQHKQSAGPSLSESGTAMRPIRWPQKAKGETDSEDKISDFPDILVGVDYADELEGVD
jgi:hypothetical protein